MDVYVMGVVFCPMNKEEQDADVCLRCRHFSGHEINSEPGKRSVKPRLYAECRFSGVGDNIYESTKSKRRITLIAEEPLPPTPESNEEWRKVNQSR